MIRLSKGVCAKLCDDTVGLLVELALVGVILRDCQAEDGKQHKKRQRDGKISWQLVVGECAGILGIN